MLDRFFRLRDHGTNARTELLGGATTFAAMAYIIVVNPAILAQAGIPNGPGTVATILTAAFGTLLMGLYANRPLAVAPYMGENVFLAFVAVGTLAITWQERLGAVFVSGVAFLLLTLVGIRTRIANAISPSLKHSFAAAIGLFLVFVGLVLTEIVTQGKGVPVKIGDFHDPCLLLAVFGVITMTALLAWRVPGAILIGMAATALLGALLQLGVEPEGVVAWPFAGDYDLSETAFQLDIVAVLQPEFLPILLTLFLMSLLDTLGTLVAVGAAGGMLDKNGNFPQIERPMLVDAASCIFGATVGTSTSGAYIESAAGVREGARTGLASITTALLFLAALFFIPLFQPLQDLRYVYGPALIVVGMMMLSSMARIDYEDLSEAVPSMATVAMVVFTYNIANGLTAGLILHPLLKALTGRIREVTLASLILGLVCLSYYVYGLTH